MGHIRYSCPTCIPPIPDCQSTWNDGCWPSVALDPNGNPRLAFEVHLLSYGGCSVQPTLAIHLESPLIHLIVAGNLHEGKMSLPGSQNPAEDTWFFQQGAVYFCIQLQYRDANSAQVFNDVITSFNFTG